MDTSQRGIFRTLDYPLLAAVLAVYAAGVLTIFSAANGASGRGFFFAGRQLAWGAVACVAFFCTLRIDFDFLLSKSYWIYGLCCAALMLLFFFGHRAKGAQSWLTFGGINVQPAEFAKLGLTFVMARHMNEYPPTNLKNFLSALALGGVSAFLVLVQPDLGSMLVYAVMIFAALFAAGTPKKYLMYLVCAGCSFLPVGWLFLKEYQKKRILVFINPELDPLGAGYNVIQSRIAVGSGRLFGKGFMEGTQSKLRFLPEPHTDFIFSVFAEEFGLFGCALLLALLSFIMWRIVSVGIRSRRISSKIIVAALSAFLWFHSFESIGMSMGFLPVTGLPLPLMSYGGSSLVSTAVALAIVMKIDAADEIERLENAVPGELSLYDL